VKTPRMFH